MGITMDVIERLTKQGKDFGYEGETLQTFVKEQQIELRDEQKAMREAECEKRKAETAKACFTLIVRPFGHAFLSWVTKRKAVRQIADNITQNHI